VVDERPGPSTDGVVVTAARLEYVAPDGRVLLSKEWQQTEAWMVEWWTPIGPFARGDGLLSVRLRYTQQMDERPEGCDVELTRTVTPSAGLAPAAMKLTDNDGEPAVITLLMKNRSTCARTRVAPVRVVFRREGKKTVWQNPDPCDDTRRWSRTGPANSFRLWDQSACGGSAPYCRLNLGLVGNRRRRLVYRVDAYWEGRHLTGGWVMALVKVHPAQRVWDDDPRVDDEFDEYCIDGANEEVEIPIHEENGREYCNRPRYVEYLPSVHSKRPRRS
jgi:hypothetical protein